MSDTFALYSSIIKDELENLRVSEESLKTNIVQICPTDITFGAQQHLS